MERTDAEAAGGSRFAFTATHATIIVALVGAIGTAAGAIITARENLRLEETKHAAAAELARQEFETKLIFRAIEGSESAEERIRNLKFFLEAGFLRDPEAKIRNLDPAKFPSKVSPSFDCLRDTDPAARLICSNPALSTQDNVMAKLYYQLKDSLAVNAEQLQKLVEVQREWLHRRDACIAATEPLSCMVNQYDMRIRQLKDQIAVQAPSRG